MLSSNETSRTQAPHQERILCLLESLAVAKEFADNIKRQIIDARQITKDRAEIYQALNQALSKLLASLCDQLPHRRVDEDQEKSLTTAMYDMLTISRIDLDKITKLMCLLRHTHGAIKSLKSCITDYDTT
jgi:hydroxylamine reductase (hybrid-cluster protein)